MNNQPSIEQVKDILFKYFNSTVRSINKINKGYTHHMYLCEIDDPVNKEIILRINFNESEYESIGKEVFVIDHYSKIEIPVPNIYFYNDLRIEHPFSYMIMSKLSGTCLNEIWEDLNIEDKKKIAFEIGKLMRKLHTVKLGNFGLIDKNGPVVEKIFSFKSQSDDKKVLDLTSYEWTLHILRIGFKDLVNLIVLDILTSEQALSIVKYLHENKHLTSNSEAVLIHGDMHLDHIFVCKENDNWNIVGLCDFEFASSHAREYDFLKLHRLGLLDYEDFKNSLLDGYGRDLIDENFDKKVIYYRLMRDIGYTFHLIKARNLKKANEVINHILTVVNN